MSRLGNYIMHFTLITMFTRKNVNLKIRWVDRVVIALNMSSRSRLPDTPIARFFSAESVHSKYILGVCEINRYVSFCELRFNCFSCAIIFSALVFFFFCHSQSNIHGYFITDIYTHKRHSPNEAVFWKQWHYNIIKHVPTHECIHWL